MRMLRIRDPGAIRNPVSYLYTVANNLVKENAALDRRQASGVDINEMSAQELHGAWPAFDGELDATQRVARLGVVLKQLRPKCRAAVELRFTHELSFREIADVGDKHYLLPEQRRDRSFQRNDGLLGAACHDGRPERIGRGPMASIRCRRKYSAAGRQHRDSDRWLPKSSVRFSVNLAYQILECGSNAPPLVAR